MKTNEDPVDDEAPLPDGFSDDEATLLRRYRRFYRSLETGERAPTTDAQRRFVTMCHGQAVASNEHESVYAKYMRLRPKRQAESVPYSAGDGLEWRDRYDREH
jgi:uncharacterized protein YifE (UPF0438 family)